MAAKKTARAKVVVKIVKVVKAVAAVRVVEKVVRVVEKATKPQDHLEQVKKTVNNQV